MSLSEEKEIKAATDLFGKAVVVFNSRDYKKSFSLFSDIVKTYSESEFYTVLEIVGKARSYASMSENQTNENIEPLESKEDFISASLMHLNSGKATEAMTLLDQGIQQFGPDARIFYTKALIYSRLDQDELALEALRFSISADQRFKITAYNEPDFEKLAENPTFRSLTA